MAWVTPVTKSTGTLITASIWNADVVANTLALKSPPTDYYNVNEAANYTTASTSFVDVDTTDLALVITTTGGDVLCKFSGCIHHDNIGPTLFDVDMDGVRQAGDDGIGGTGTHTAARLMNVSFEYWIIAPSAASHTFKLQWRTVNGTATMPAGAGTANQDIHPQFLVREAT